MVMFFVIEFESILRYYVQYDIRPTVGRNSDEIRPELVGLVSKSRRIKIGRNSFDICQKRVLRYFCKSDL